MSPSRRWLPAFALLVAPFAATAGDYVGVLRPTAWSPAIAIPEPGFYWPLADPFQGRYGVMATQGFRLKLGYNYSRFLSVETGFADSGSARGMRGRGFTMDTIGTVPLWTHAALYGRLGAWRAGGGTTLLAGAEVGHRQGAGLRYGLGLKYDVTRSLGLQAEMERFSPLDRWGSRDSDTDQVTVGVTWRF